MESESKNNLNICPFCKSENVKITNEQYEDGWVNIVECQKCLARGPIGYTEKTAEILWNIVEKKP